MKLSFPLFLLLTGSFTQTTSGISIAGPDKNEINAIETKNSESSGPFQFAVVNEVSITPCSGDGTIDGNTWHLNVESPGAKSLNFGFEKLQLSNGAKMRIKDAKNSESSEIEVTVNRGEYWSGVIPTDEVNISIDFPDGVKCDDVQLSSINVGFTGFGAEKSGSCNVDVVCPDRVGWETEIASVAKYIHSGRFLCTGAMINNMREDRTPYFLTADHCGVRNNNVASIVTYWNYETSVCGGTPDGNTLDTLNGGGTIIGKNSVSDAMLILLNDQIPPEYGITFAGWDNTPEAYDLPGVAIHHPSGDEKRISFEYDPMASTNWYSNTVRPGGTHVKVYDWDTGTTEGGSSGSPLFNGKNRIIGQLEGGEAACGNNRADWYGRFSRTWSDSSAIRTALDPDNVLDGGNGGIDSFDPYAFPTVSPRPSKSPTESPSSSPTVSLHPSKSPTESPSSSPTVSLHPSKSPTESPTRPPCFGASFLLQLQIDNYGNEVTWDLTAQDATSPVANGGPYADFEAVEVYECIDNGCYEFIIYDSYGDGLCCSSGRGSYSITVDGVIKEESNGRYKDSESTQFCTSNGTCADSGLEISLDSGTFGCDIVVANDACDRAVAASHCPLTCSACDEYGCADSSAPLDFNGNRGYCEELAGLDDDLFGQLCGIDSIASTCRATCNFCS